MIAPTKPVSAVPDWIDDQLIAQTIAAWSPLYGRSLTNAEAIEILLSVDRLIDAIQECNA